MIMCAVCGKLTEYNQGFRCPECTEKMRTYIKIRSDLPVGGLSLPPETEMWYVALAPSKTALDDHARSEMDTRCGGGRRITISGKGMEG